MIALLGETALAFALLAAIIQSVLPLYGYYKNNPYLLAIARPAAFFQCALLCLAFGLLVSAFAYQDSSILYVAHHSHTTLPLMYQLTAAWGGHEGSMLLWITLLGLWTIAFAMTQTEKTNRAITLSMLGCLNVGLITFLLFTSNPFLQTTEVLTGSSLNPLLQDPAFMIHPPMLYAGYVGFSVTFAMTLAALICQRLDKQWASTMRYFALAAWCFLTLGILLGSWWAYRVLGWGGFWFWDPVENASLLPWLTGTALIHILILVEHQQTAKGWAALLALLCFCLSLLGTFLVRSGILISVHTFASDPQRGIYLLLLLSIILLISLSIYFIQLPKITSKPLHTTPLLSRTFSLLLNNVLLVIGMLTILLGTLYPLILETLHLGFISVGAPYFNIVMTPIAFLIMASMGLASFSRWHPPHFAKQWPSIRNQLLLSAIIAIVLDLYFTHTLTLIHFFTLFLSSWIMISLRYRWRLLPGMFTAHLGFAVLMLGIMLSSCLSETTDVRLHPNEQTHLGPYQFVFTNTKEITMPHYRSIQADFAVFKAGKLITHLYPEKRLYTVSDTVMSKVDLHPGLFRDLYIALGEPLAGEDWSVRIYYKPFISWVWLGGFLMLLGGLIVMVKRLCKP